MKLDCGDKLGLDQRSPVSKGSPCPGEDTGIDPLSANGKKLLKLVARPVYSKAERRKIVVRKSFQSLISNGPPNKRIEAISEATAEAIYELLGDIGELVITPKPGVIGLSGFRRSNVLPIPVATGTKVA